MDEVEIDPYTATARDLQQLLKARLVTSTNLVGLYLDEISKNNHNGLNLRAVLATTPREFALEEARKLDEERENGIVRSVAHGIPILVKDNICTSTFQLPTTSGSLALKDLIPNTDANIVTLLREAGCVIIGKTNLSELGNSKGTDIMSGWSALGGQTQAPYVRGGVDPKDLWLGHYTPGGSSSGSAVGVAVGFAPWSIGVESDGSIVTPSARAALYGMKASIGRIDMSATQSAGSTFISAGGLTRCAADLADLMGILIPTMTYKPEASPAWEKMRIACVKLSHWRLPESACKHENSFINQSEFEMSKALDKIESLGARVTRDVPLNSIVEFDQETGITTRSLIVHQVRPTIEKYLSFFNCSEMQTLDDLVQFNEDHAVEELPPGKSNQDFLKEAQADTMTDEEFQPKMKRYRTEMRKKIKKCLDDHSADFIMAPGDSLLCTIAMAAGYPIANVPLGFARLNGRPFGMQLMGREGEESSMLKLMAAWESAFPKATRSPFFVED